MWYILDWCFIILVDLSLKASMQFPYVRGKFIEVLAKVAIRSEEIKLDLLHLAKLWLKGGAQN